MFPAWADVLGLPDAQLIGVDLPLNAPPMRYRQAVRQIKEDALSLGAIITSHKLGVFQAAGDLFAGFSAEAELCREVACIYKREGRLLGHATDPLVSGLALEHLLGADYWRRHPTDLLCLGAGGAAVALVVQLLTQNSGDNRPQRLILVDRDRQRLAQMEGLLERLPSSGIALELMQAADPLVNDSLLQSLSPYSLVVNATGMGKDLPGSPITEAAVFPENGAAWELNYRGERLFLHQAEAQAAERHLRVGDGWHYFLRGWATNISYIFDLPINHVLFAQLERAAAAVR